MVVNRFAKYLKKVVGDGQQPSLNILSYTGGIFMDNIYFILLFAVLFAVFFTIILTSGFFLIYIANLRKNQLVENKQDKQNQLQKEFEKVHTKISPLTASNRLMANSEIDLDKIDEYEEAKIVATMSSDFEQTAIDPHKIKVDSLKSNYHVDLIIERNGLEQENEFD